MLSQLTSQQTQPFINVGSMLVYHLRRRPNIKPTLDQRLEVAGVITVNEHYRYTVVIKGNIVYVQCLPLLLHSFF